MQNLLDFEEYESYQKALKEYEEKNSVKKESQKIRNGLQKGLAWCRQGDKKLRRLR